LPPAEPDPAAVTSGCTAAALDGLVLGEADAAALGVAAGPLRLRRAWPDGPGRLTCEHLAADGALLAGQTGADLARIVEQTRRRGPAALLDAPAPLLLQARGADRRLDALGAVLAEPGAQLLVHRAERRAVVRTNGTYVKVVRPKRGERLARTARAAERAARDAPFATAAVVAARPEAGVVRFAALSGRTLHDALPTADAAAAAGAAGAALRGLHDLPAPAGVPLHDGAAAAGELERWSGALRAHARPGSPAGALADAVAERAPEVGDRLRALRAETGLVHRDLHDKQVLVGAGGAVGLLDFDTLAAGDAALDLANLLVHLDLRALQGHCSADAARAAREAVLAAYAPSEALAGRAAVYAAATRLRLVCVYAFRPVRPGVLDGLLD
jgi:aminoglycoside phosphotransferase (APT) family kinase protein